MKDPLSIYPCLFLFKGYSRKGAALSFLKRYDDAITVYEEGLKIDPKNQQLLTDLEAARKDKSKSSEPEEMNIFSDPQFVSQLMANPKARELLKDSETADLLRQARQNPNDPVYVFLLKELFFASLVFFRLLRNPKIMKLLGLVLGFDLGGGNDFDSKMETESASSTTKKETSTSKPTETSKPAPAELTPVRNFLICHVIMFARCV